MDRINELLAKLTELSPEELAELDGLLQSEANVCLDRDGGPTDEDLANLNVIADGVAKVRAEDQRRIEAEDARVAEAERLRGLIRGDATEDQGDDAPADEEPADPTAEVEPVDVPADEPVPVTAAAPIPARPVSVPRPANTAPRKTAGEHGVSVLTAAANVPGIQGGSKLDNDEKLYAAFDAAASLAMTASADFKMPVAVARVQYPDDLTLTMDGHANRRKVDARTSREALTASGGICAPIPYRYDLQTVGVTDRPVRDSALAKFGVQSTRGGIKTLIPPTITDVSNLATGPVSLWTEANDQNPTSPTTKPIFTIPCTNTESSTRVYAIPMAFKIGNFRERWFPENIKAFTSLAAVWQARYAEAKLLATIAAGSKVVTHGQVLGSAQDVFTALRQLRAGILYRHRLDRNTTFRVVGFQWVLDNIVTDMIRKGSGDETDVRLRMKAETEVNAYFAALGMNITWSPDFELGKSIGQNGGPLAGTQGVGPVIGYPDKARFYVYLEGAWLFLDGGEINLGVIRDQTLVGTNDAIMFSETFENAHYDSVPSESYVYDIDICANGGVASALDIAPCVSGS